MADPTLLAHLPTSAGFSTVIPAFIGSAFAAAMAFWVKWQRDRENEPDPIQKAEKKDADSQRSHLDIAERNFRDRLIEDNDRLRAEAMTWEASARRVDRIAHHLRHEVANLRQKLGDMTPVDPIPFLEDDIE
jgi:hypothetical protein